MSDETNDEQTPAVNMSLRRKHAARIAAVQCLYAVAMNPSLSNQQLIDWQLEQTGEERWLPVQPETKLLRQVLVGTRDHQEAIDHHLGRILEERWSGKRMSQTMRAVFRAAVYELLFQTGLEARIIIDQYVGVADTFLDANDVSFVNGVLIELCRDLRPNTNFDAPGSEE